MNIISPITTGVITLIRKICKHRKRNTKPRTKHFSKFLHYCIIEKQYYNMLTTQERNYLLEYNVYKLIIDTMYHD